MVVRQVGFKAAFLEGFERYLKSVGKTKTDVVRDLAHKEDGKGGIASRQAIGRWFREGRIQDKNLKVLATYLAVDYEQLRLHGAFVPAGQGRPPDTDRRRKGIKEPVAASYLAADLPTGRQMAARWDALPVAVRGFLLYQIQNIEQLGKANSILHNYAFMPPTSPGYSAWEEEQEAAIPSRKRPSAD